MSVSVSGIYELFEDATLVGNGLANTALTGATHDSRYLESGWLFCCVTGENQDGHDFAEAAVNDGAVALLVERQLDLPVPQVVVPNVRAAMGLASAAIYGFPSTKLTVVGVTGTNGKSSIVQLLSDIWTAAGLKNEIFGTLQGPRTTPEAPDLQRSLAEAVSKGVQAVAMEVSSHALSLGRVNGTNFELAIFTNLGHDHLDFHSDMEEYFAAKSMLFAPEFTSKAVINADDEYGQRLLKEVSFATAYSTSAAEALVQSGATNNFRWRGKEVELQLAGTYNLSNAIAAAEAATLLGVSQSEIVKGLNSTRPVKGRFEVVSPVDHPFIVAVDYAHTPDALRSVLQAARQASSSNRVILVFGCGGNRDAEKRPVMGGIACDDADLAILTTDNPRFEDANSIQEEVLAGAQIPEAIVNIADRRSAIVHAVEEARSGDVVVIAGKGHESGQVVGSTVHPFNDVEVATEVLELNK